MPAEQHKIEKGREEEEGKDIWWKEARDVEGREGGRDRDDQTLPIITRCPPVSHRTRPRTHSSGHSRSQPIVDACSGHHTTCLPLQPRPARCPPPTSPSGACARGPSAFLALLHAHHISALS
eukprot:749126-Hanusia_phi.AAC.3